MRDESMAVLPNELCNPSDQRALELVAYDLPFYQAVALGCSAMMVSPLSSRGLPKSRAACVDGDAPSQAVRRKESYPEF